MIRSVALLAAVRMGKQLKSNDEDVEVYAFSLEIIITELVQYSLYLMIAIMANVLNDTAFVLLGFCAFRLWGGGPHMKTFGRCLISSGSTIAILVALSLPVWPSTLRYTAEALIFFLALITIQRWVPAGKASITNKEIIKSRRQKTFMVLAVLTAAIAIMEVRNDYEWLQPLLMGIVGCTFFIMPIGYKFLSWLDSVLDNNRREV